jgi:hypothetical protein
MATGKVASVQLTGGSITAYSLAYSAPTGYYGVYNVSFTNTSSAAQSIRMYVGASTVGSQNASEVFEWQTTIAPYGVFERTGLVVSAGQNIIVSSTGGSGGQGTATGSVTVNVYGIETSTS